MSDTPPPEEPENAVARRWRIAIGLGVVAVIAVGALIAVVVSDDDESMTDTTSSVPTATSAPTGTSAPTSAPPATTDPTTTSAATTVPPTTVPPTTDPTTTSATTTTSTSTTTTSTSTTPATTPPPVDGDLTAALWPDPAGPVGYTVPDQLVAAFAADVVGMTDPDIGPFRQGDARSGEVEVRVAPGAAAVSTVLVRQLGPNDLWWVTGAVTDDIVVDEPDPLAEVTSPLTLAGSGVAFEGTINVTLWADGDDVPLAETFVTASGGPTPGPFSGTLTFTTPEATGGGLLFTSTSAEDDSVVAFAAIRVLFP